MKRVRWLIVPLLAAGCATQPFVPPGGPESSRAANTRRAEAAAPGYNLAGYPPAVREGYIDGCESAKKTRQARKDAARFAADAQYSMGWNDGFSICARK